MAWVAPASTAALVNGGSGRTHGGLGLPAGLGGGVGVKAGGGSVPPLPPRLD